MEKFFAFTARILANRKNSRVWHRASTVLAMMLVFTTTYMLILPALQFENYTVMAEEEIGTDDVIQEDVELQNPAETAADNTAADLMETAAENTVSEPADNTSLQEETVPEETVTEEPVVSPDVLAENENDSASVQEALNQDDNEAAAPAATPGNTASEPALPAENGGNGDLDDGVIAVFNEESENAGSLAYENENVRVEASFDNSGYEAPKGLTLKAVPFTYPSNVFDAYNQAVDAKLAEQGNYVVSYSAYYDIWLELNGETVNPAPSAKITIQFKDKALLESGKKLFGFNYDDTDIVLSEDVTTITYDNSDPSCPWKSGFAVNSIGSNNLGHRVVGVLNTVEKVETVEEIIEEDVTVDETAGETVSGEINADDENADDELVEESAGQETESTDTEEVPDASESDTNDTPDETTVSNDENDETENGENTLNDASGMAEDVSLDNGIEEETPEYKTGTINVLGMDYVVEVTLDETAKIPAEASLTVSEISPAREEYQSYFEQAMGAIGEEGRERENAFARFFDISFLLDGVEVEPDPEATVDVKISFLQTVDQKIDTENAETGEVNTVHFTEEGVETVETETVGNAGEVDEISFEASSFSVYGFVYTVDFHYNGVDYSIPGESQILLSELIDMLQIMNGDELLNVADVAAVEFTDEHLVTVEEVSGLITIINQNEEKVDVEAGEKNFLLSSKASFTSDEKLTVTLMNGEEIVVGVTDAQTYEYTLDGASDTITVKALYDYFGDPLNYDNNLVFCIDYGIGDPEKVTFEYLSATWDHSGIQSTYEASSKTITISGLSTIPAGECVIVNLMQVDAFDQPSFKLTQPVKEKECIFTYTLDEDNYTATITGFVEGYDTVGDIDIPEALTVDRETYNVTKIAAGAFNGNDLLKKVTFKGNINILTDGDTYAFAGSNITEAVFEKATEIGDYAFKGCASLNSVSFDGYSCTLHTGAFKDCASLASVTYDSEKCWMSLGGDAFNGCSSLTGDFPGLRYVAYGAFYGTNIDSAEVIGWGSFSGASFNGVKKPIDFTLTGDDLHIEYGKLNATTNFKSITINAKSSLSFDQWSMQGDYSTGSPKLESITINCDESIGLCDDVLEYLKAGNQTITINAPVSFIKANAFQQCGGANMTIEFKKSVGSIANYAFNSCTFGAGSRVIFDEDVDTIAYSAFQNSTFGANSSIEFKGKAGELGRPAFYSVSFGSGATVAFNQLDSFEEWSDPAFHDCTFAGNNSIDFGELSSVPANIMNNCTINGATEVNITASGDTISVDENCFPDDANLTVFFQLYRDDVTGADAMEDAHPNTTFRYLGDAIDLRDADKYQVLLSSMIETKEPAILDPDSGEKLDVADVESVAFAASETGSAKLLKAGTTYKYNGQDDGVEFTANDFLLQNDTDTFNTVDDDEIVITLKSGKKVYVNKKLRYTAHQNPFSLNAMLSELELPTDSLMALTLVDSTNHILMAADEAGTDQELTLFSQLPEAGLTVQLKNGEDLVAKIVILQGEEITFPMMDDSGIFTLEWYGGNEGGNAVNITGLTEHYGKLPGQDGNVQIPGYVKFHGADKEVYVITTGAFKDEVHLVSVTFTNKADYIQINEGAFDNCANLTSISGTAPVDLMTKAIENCPALTNADLTLKNIRNDQFPIITGNAVLTDVRLVYPKLDYYNLTGGIVSGNNALKNLTVDNGNKPFIGIAAEAFKGMTSLETVTILPYVQVGSDGSIGASAFEGCTGLKTVTLGEGNNNNGEDLEIGDDAFKNTNIGPDCVVDVWQYSKGSIIPPHLPLGASLLIIKDDEEHDVVTAEDEEAIRAEATEYYKPNTFDIVFFDVSLAAPNGESCSFATEDEDEALDVIMDAQLPWKPVGGVTDPRPAVIHKHGDEIESFSIWDADKDYTDGQINRVRFELMSLSPLGIAARTPYHDDLYWYTLSERTQLVPDEDGSGNYHYETIGTNARIVGLYDETATDLVIPGETRDDNKYTVNGISDNAFKGLQTINSVAFENTEAITISGSAFEGSSIKTVEFRNSGEITEIYSRVFADCPNLESVTFNGNAAKSVRFSRSEIFADCPNLKSLTSTADNLLYPSFRNQATDTFKGSPLETIDLLAYSVPSWNNLSSEPLSSLKTLKYTLTSDSNGAGFATVPSDDYLPALESVEVNPNKRALTINENAFGSATSLTSVKVVYPGELSGYATAGTVTVKANAFSKASALSYFETNANTKIKADAFKGASSLNTVILASNPEKSSSDINAIDAGAFPNLIQYLRVDRPLSVLTDAFAGGEFYVSNCTTLNKVADMLGKFTNHIYMNQLTSADQNAFSGSADKQPDKVYFAQPFENKDLNGEPVMVRGNKSIASADPNITFYFDCEKADNPLADDLDNRLLGAGANAPKVRYLHTDDDVGVYYMSGKATNPNPVGTREDPFKTFAQLKAATGGKNPDKRTETETLDGYADAINAVKLSKDGDPSFEISYKGKIYVLDAINVTGTETWESNASQPIEMYRDPSNTTDAMVNVTGNLTLKNVVLDGNNEKGIKAEKPIIYANGAVLTLHEGAVVRNNDRVRFGYPDKAGAIYVSGHLTMDGGEVSGSTGVYGGGVQVCGSGSVFDMSGGVIKNNKTIASKESYGGGVNVGSGATMNLSGGSIENNEVFGIGSAVGGQGGGIALGAEVSGMCQQAKLNMTGGKVQNNTSSESGGGIFIQTNCTATIKKGEIINNTSKGGAYGGGGIYVNGVRDDTQDGKLYLPNTVLITDNEARETGGGLAACCTSTTYIYYGNGAAMYGNTSDDGSDFHVGTEQHITDWGTQSGTPFAYVSPYMFDGTEYNWTNTEGTAYTPGELAKITGTTSLKADPGDSAPTRANVIITGNKSATKGGGIGADGFVQIGDAPEPQELKWTPEVFKMLHNRDMEVGDEFTFEVWKEVKIAHPDYIDAFSGRPYQFKYEDELIETVKLTITEDNVAKAKEGEKVKVEIAEINLGEVTAADIGTLRTYIIKEVDLKPGFLPVNTYLAINVAIGGKLDKETMKETFSAEVNNIEIGKIKDDGEYEYMAWGTGGSATKEKSAGRSRSTLDTLEAVVENTSTDTNIKAKKEWKNYDGEIIQPPTGSYIELELLADGQPFDSEKKITLNGTVDNNGESASWVAEWNNLPVYKVTNGEFVKDENGELIKIGYSVKEVEVHMNYEYDAIYSSEAQNTPVSIETNGTGTIVNTQETGNLKVSKKVISNRQNDLSKAFKMTVTLMDKQKKAVLINGTFGEMTFKNGVAEFSIRNGEEVKATGLPKGLLYKVEEESLNDYDAEYLEREGKIGDTEIHAVVKNTPVTKISVNKIWLVNGQKVTGDPLSSDGTVIDSIGVELFKNDETVALENGSLSKASKWSWTSTKILPEFEEVDGIIVPITYRVEEVDEGNVLAGYEVPRYKQPDVEKEDASSTITNNIYKLPDAGGAGTTIFYLVGVSLLGFAAMMFLLTKRRHNN